MLAKLIILKTLAYRNNYPNTKLLQSRLKELGDIESRSKNKQMTMPTAQFQQMKSTEAVHIRLSHGIWLARDLQPCSANTDLIPDHKPSQLGMYSSVGDKKEF